MTLNQSRATLLAVLPLTLLLAACGGGASVNDQGSFLNGQVLMGAGRPVDDNGTGNVCIYAITGGLGNPVTASVSPPTNTGTLLTSGCIPTAADGSFSANLTSFYGPVLIQITGGSYASVATSGRATLANLVSTNASLRAIVNIGGGGTVNAVVTPLTTVATAIAQSLPGGLTLANYAEASNTVAAEFQLGSLNINSAPTADDPYDLALNGVQDYLAAPPGAADDPNANNLLTWTLTASNVRPTTQPLTTSSAAQN